MANPHDKYHAECEKQSNGILHSSGLIRLFVTQTHRQVLHADIFITQAMIKMAQISCLDLHPSLFV